MRTHFLRTIGILIIVLLSACNFPGPGQAIPGAPAVPDTLPIEETVEPVQEAVSTDCAFMWANKPLPELSDELIQVMKDYPLESEGYAQAYGENCVTSEGEVVRFLAMETDFYITLQVDDLEDERTLGELVEQVMEMLTEFPTEATPGPQPGYVGITFEAPEDSLRLWVMRTKIETALDNGLRGEELLKALQE
jgi:hypothetical protein